SGYFQGKAVAIMRLNTVDVDEESIQNCLASIQLLMACKHPFIVRVENIVRSPQDEIRVIVEDMPGSTLANVLQTQSLLWPEKLRMCYQISAALEYAHKHLQCPRTLCLTPNKVLISSNKTCKLNVLDYIQSLDSFDQSNEDSGFEWRGMPWEAPEVLSNQSRRTPEADMYAFGVICCEIAMGSQPTKTWIHTRAYEEDPTLAACPSFFQSIVFACLEMDPTKRPTAHAVAMEFSTMK
ncbi:hypothetical protein THRCLA_09876, partial [Thraustotheca clavata]